MPSLSRRLRGCLGRTEPKSIAIAAALAILLGPDYFVHASSVAVVIAIVSYAGAIISSTTRDATVARVSLVSAAVAAACAWVVSPEQWPWAAFAVLASLVARRPTRFGAALAMVPLVVPISMVFVSVVFGLDDARAVLVQSLRSVLPPWSVLLIRGVAIVAAVWLASRRWRVDEDASERSVFPGAHTVSATGAAAVVMLLWSRFEALLANARIPSDSLQWSESPLLMNVVKQRQGLPIYSSMDEVSSFTYAPLFELLQASVLRPFGAELNIVGHRCLVAVWQVLASALVGYALLRVVSMDAPPQGRIARLGAAVAGVAVTLGVLAASPTSWFLHPDHAVNALVAVSVVSILDVLPYRRASVLVAWLAPPVAAAFKMTGCGLAVAFGLVGLMERSRPALFRAIGGGVLVGGAVVLLEYAFPAFYAYGIELMASHTLRAERLRDAIGSPWARVFVVAVLLSACTASSLQGRLRRLLAFSVGIGAVTVLAFLKDGGRANNLVAPALVASITVLLALYSLIGAPREHALVWAPAALLVLLPFRHEPASDAETERAKVILDHRAVVDFLRAERAAGRKPLVQGNTIAWLESGGRGIRSDDIYAAVELYLGEHPAFDRHLERLRSGMYESIVTPGLTFVADGIPSRPFGALMRRTLEPQYCVVYPVQNGAPVPLTFGRRVLILRRRDLGCDAISS